MKKSFFTCLACWREALSHLQAELPVTNTIEKLTPKCGENSKKLTEERSENVTASMKSFKTGRKSPSLLTKTRWNSPCSLPTSLGRTRITTEDENLTVPEQSTLPFRTYCHHRRQDGTSGSLTGRGETEVFSLCTSSWNVRERHSQAQRSSTQNRFRKRMLRKRNNITQVRIAKMTGHLREGWVHQKALASPPTTTTDKRVIPPNKFRAKNAMELIDSGHVQTFLR